jgi:hypothetical protein
MDQKNTAHTQGQVRAKVRTLQKEVYLLRGRNLDLALDRKEAIRQKK